MSDDKLAEIRARHALYPPGPNARHSSIVAYRDIATLLAEVDRRGAENERMRADLALEQSRIVLQRGEIEKLRAENERLKQEPELLRAELIAITNAARKALSDAYGRAREGRDAFQQQAP